MAAAIHDEGASGAPASAPLPSRSAATGDAGTPDDGGLVRTGVVFVHGIGDQKQSATLREQGGPLLDWVWGWHTARGIRGDDALIPQWSKLSYAAPLEGPARFALGMPAYTSADSGESWPAREWIVAEGWWAPRLEPPSAVAMLTWSLRILGQFWESLTDEALGRTHLGRSLPSFAIPETRLATALELVGNGFLVVAYLLLSVLSFPLVFGLLVIAQIPIPPLQRFVLLELVRPLLVDRIGDFWIYLHDYPQAMHIRRAVEEAVDYLASREDCRDILVVAHSQGTVVAFDALTSKAIKHIDRVRTFITVGGALNRAWTLEQGVKMLDGKLPAHIRWVDIRASYDPVPGEPLTRFRDRAHDVEIANAMNVISDHDDYWRNPEQFISRLAQEIDVASVPGLAESAGKHEASRFWPGQERQRLLVLRRLHRAYALVFWRIVAFVLLAAALWHRIHSAGPQGQPGTALRIVQDGRSYWAALRGLPGAQLVLTPIEAVGQWIDRALGTAGGWLAVIFDRGAALTQAVTGGAVSPGLIVVVLAVAAAAALFARSHERLALTVLAFLGSGIVVRLAILSRIRSYEAAGMFVLAVLVFAVLFMLAYLLGRAILFAGWQDREQRASNAPTDSPARRDVPVRVAAMLLVLALPAAIVAFTH
ncbi:hypothetical protein BH18CHL2_BH18CHL2_03630 [soil metagenome]